MKEEERQIGLWRYGCEFVAVGHDALACHRKREKDGYDLQRNHVPPRKVPPFPIYYNFLHGIELGLKAYLRHVDAVPLKDLRDSKKFGHRLDRLLTKALCHHLREACPNLTDSHIGTICCSSRLYAGKGFEYIQIGPARLKLIDQVVEVADTLIAGLGGLICKRIVNRHAAELPWLKNAIDAARH